MKGYKQEAWESNYAYSNVLSDLWQAVDERDFFALLSVSTNPINYFYDFNYNKLAIEYTADTSTPVVTLSNVAAEATTVDFNYKNISFIADLSQKNYTIFLIGAGIFAKVINQYRVRPDRGPLPDVFFLPDKIGETDLITYIKTNSASRQSHLFIGGNWGEANFSSPVELNELAILYTKHLRTQGDYNKFEIFASIRTNAFKLIDHPVSWTYTDNIPGWRVGENTTELINAETTVEDAITYQISDMTIEPEAEKEYIYPLAHLAIREMVKNNDNVITHVKLGWEKSWPSRGLIPYYNLPYDKFEIDRKVLVSYPTIAEPDEEVIDAPELFEGLILSINSNVPKLPDETRPLFIENEDGVFFEKENIGFSLINHGYETPAEEPIQNFNSEFIQVEDEDENVVDFIDIFDMQSCTILNEYTIPIDKFEKIPLGASINLYFKLTTKIIESSGQYKEANVGLSPINNYLTMYRFGLNDKMGKYERIARVLDRFKYVAKRGYVVIDDATRRIGIIWEFRNIRVFNRIKEALETNDKTKGYYPRILYVLERQAFAAESGSRYGTDWDTYPDPSFDWGSNAKFFEFENYSRFNFEYDTRPLPGTDDEFAALGYIPSSGDISDLQGLIDTGINNLDDEGNPRLGLSFYLFFKPDFDFIYDEEWTEDGEDEEEPPPPPPEFDFNANITLVIEGINGPCDDLTNWALNGTHTLEPNHPEDGYNWESTGVPWIVYFDSGDNKWYVLFSDLGAQVTNGKTGDNPLGEYTFNQSSSDCDVSSATAVITQSE
jgi:hypothetical protein